MGLTTSPALDNSSLWGNSGLIVVLVVLVALLTGALLGFLVAQLRSVRRIEQLRVDLEAARVRLEAATRSEAERIELLEDSESRLRSAFDSLAGQTLRANSEMFLRMARETLGRDQVIAQGSLKERETAIAQLVGPLRAALEKTEAQVAAMERERRDAFSSLRTQIEALTSGQSLLQRETRNLVTALRRPEVRGRWGELTLRRLVELAGMSEHCDFTEQLQVMGEDGALRPDLVVHMPDSRDLVVDVKTPLDAYLEALEATTEEARVAQLRRHAQQVETRVRQLASKSYWAQFEHSPEFAVLFLPGDQFLAAALTERPELLEAALKQNVIIATPSTLIALLKTVAYGWRQSAVAQNAAIIRELGQELYRRLGNFTGHLGRTGQRLGAAVEAYNAAVGSLERQVLPQARRFTDLGVTADSPLPALEPIDELARVPAQAAADESVSSLGDELAGGISDAPAGHVSDAAAGHVSDVPMGGANDVPVGGANDAAAGRVSDTAVGGVSDAAAGRVSDVPVGGANDAAAGGVSDTAVGGANDVPAGRVSDTAAGGVSHKPASAISGEPAGRIADELGARHADAAPGARALPGRRDVRT